MYAMERHYVIFGEAGAYRYVIKPNPDLDFDSGSYVIVYEEWRDAAWREGSQPAVYFTREMIPLFLEALQSLEPST